MNSALDKLETRRHAASGPCSRHGVADEFACRECSIRRTAICAALDDRQIVALGEISFRRWIDGGRVLVMEGDAANFAYNVVSGMMKLYKGLADGRLQIVGFLLPGDFLGLPSRGRYVYSAEAILRTQICTFPSGTLQGVFDGNPGLEKRLLSIINDDLALAQDHMLLLGRRRAEERIACFLRALLARYQRVGLPTHPLHLPMGRVDIADYLGLTIETVSRSFSKLRKDGVIALPRSDNVVLLRKDRLDEICDSE